MPNWPALKTSGLPETAIHFCLKHAGLEWRELDAVAVAAQPVQGWLRRSTGAARRLGFSPLASAYCQMNDWSKLVSDLGDLRILKSRGISPGRLFTFEHHLCHAATTFYLSPFERALIVTLDENGDGRTGTICLGKVRASGCSRPFHSRIHWRGPTPELPNLLASFRKLRNTRRNG